MSIIITNTNTLIKNTTTTSGADSVLGGLDTDLIDGLAGNDTIDGQGGNDGIMGGDGNDTINGSMGDDTILGDAGNDVIDGDQGDDHIDGGAGDDTLRGGIEDDVIEDLAGNNSIDGGDANDTLKAGSGHDTIDGGNGDDIIDAGDGNNKVNGNISSYSISASSGTGNDKITTGSGNDSITGGSGNDTIDAGAGDNWIYDNGGTNTITTGSGSDIITASSGNDTINAGDGNNTITDSGGTNTITTGKDNDKITAGSGSDTINAGNGDNIVQGGYGNDTITTGTGNDNIDGGAGNDSIIAGAGNDTITGDATDTIDGGVGDDSFKLTLTGTGGSVTGGDGNDVFEAITGSSGATSITGGTGKDTYKLTSNTTGQFIITDFTAGAGGDFVNVEALLTASKGVAVNGYSGGNPFASDQGYFILEPSESGADTLLKFDKDGKNGYGTPVTLITFKNLQKSALTSDNFSYGIKPDGSKVDGKTLVGTSGNDVYTLDNAIDNNRTSLFDDTITGNAGDDSIKADGGADSIHGNDGNDTIYAGSGNDTIDGGLGNDTIFGEEGNDSIIGGEGNNSITDTAGDNKITTGSGADTITTSSSSGNDTINAGDGNNTIKDSGGTNTITTGKDHDNITTGSGNDTINAGDGNNYISDGGGTNTITTGKDNDTIYGSSGNDTISAGDGNNYISDGGGTNTITTGSGNDTIYGGYGNDTINAGDGNNSISDSGGTNTITTGSGVDTITTYGSGTINSGAGNDTLTLSNSSGTIDAGDGDDLAILHGNNFTITGGNGRDLYRPQGYASSITITDFKAGTAGDMIDLTDLLEYSANQTNGYVGGNPFAADQGYLSLEQSGSGSDTLLKFYADGKTGTATTAKTVLTLKGVTKSSITAENFVDRINPTGSVIANLTLTGTASTDAISPKYDKTNTTTNYANDTINGLAGNDTIYGKGGHDTIDAGDGNDAIYGGMGNDTIIGNNGNDTIYGDQGNDSLIGGAGDDTITDATGNEIIDGGEGNNTITDTAGDNKITSGAGNDNITTGSGNDTITAGDGNNYINESSYGGGSNSITAGLGADTIYGGSGNDMITAGDGNNYITDGGGTNTITTGKDNDIIYGGYGNDTITVGDGNNYISDGGGTNTITTGKDNDIINAGSGNDTITAGDGKNAITGGYGNDSITAGIGNDTIDGGGGDDSITADAGDDSIIAGAGKDTITAGAGNDTITADESDKLDGGVGDDIFKLKNQSNDSITGGQATGSDGNDLFEVISPYSTYYNTNSADFPNYTIAGGNGIDTYKPLPSMLLTVSDFKVGAGGDMINITNILNYSADLGKAKGGYTGGNPFNVKQVYLKLEQHGQDTWLLFDADGIGATTNSLKKVMVLKNVKIDDLTSDNIVKDVSPNDPPVPVDPKGTDPSDPIPADTTPPVLLLQGINTDGTKIILTYDEALDPANPPPLSSFSVSLNGTSITPTGISIADKQILLTLPTTVTQSDDLLMSYTQPTTGNDVKATQDKAGNDSANFIDHAVEKKTLNTLFTITDTTADDTFISQSQPLSPILTGTISYAFIIDAKGTKATTITTDYGILSIDKTTNKITLDSSSKTTDTKIEGLISNPPSLSFKLSATNGKDTQEGTVSIKVVGVDDLTDFTGTKTGSVTKNDVKASKSVGTITADDRDTPLDKKIVAESAKKGVYGEFSITATGQWSYILNNAKDAPIYSLKAGEQTTEVFAVKTAGNSTQNIIITINGADDSLIQDPNSPPLDTNKPFYIGSGRINADTITLYCNKMVDKNNLANVNAFKLDIKRLDGTKESITPISVSSSLNQVTLKLKPEDMIYRKDIVSMTYTDQTTGNDTNAIQDNSGTDAKTVTFGLFNNTISFTDTIKADNIPAKAVTSYLSAPTPNATYSILSGGKSLTTLTTEYGTFSIDAKTGMYSFLPTGLSIESLKDNNTLNFTIQALKDKAVVNTEEVKVYLIGVNDKAIFKGTGVQKATVKDAADPTLAKGKVTASDVDKVSNATIKAEKIETDYGTFDIKMDGSWIYTLKNNAPAVNKLVNGQEYKENITIQTIDGDTDTITIKVIGSNDASVITGDYKGTVTEDNQLMVTGHLTITDIDEGEDKIAVVQLGKDKTTRVDLSQTSSIDGAYGTLKIDSTGNWEYLLNNTSPLVQALYETEKPVETFYFYPIEDLQGKAFTAKLALPPESKKIEITVQGEGKKITGTKNAESLLGTDQEDLIDGGLGADTMLGGQGNDIYAIENIKDTVIENPDEGLDTLRFDKFLDYLANYQLAENIENIHITAKIGKAITLIGNTENNIFIANSNFNDTFSGLEGNDVFDAGKGKNTLTGGSGADAFISGGASGSEVMLGRQPNLITDFDSGEGDKIRLVVKADTFKELLSQTGNLLPDAHFFLGKTASAPTASIIYDQSTGNLYYDADGSGTKAKQIQLATLNNKATLDANDIQLVGVADAYISL